MWRMDTLFLPSCRKLKETCYYFLDIQRTKWNTIRITWSSATVVLSFAWWQAVFGTPSVTLHTTAWKRVMISWLRVWKYEIPFLMDSKHCKLPLERNEKFNRAICKVLDMNNSQNFGMNVTQSQIKKVHKISKFYVILYKIGSSGYSCLVAFTKFMKTRNRSKCLQVGTAMTQKRKKQEKTLFWGRNAPVSLKHEEHP